MLMTVCSAFRRERSSESSMGANGENIEIPGAVKTVFAKLEEEFGERLLDSSLFRGELTFVIAPGDYLDILTFCKESEDLQFDRLDCLMGNHFPEREDKPFQVLVHLVSQPNNTRLRLKVLLAEGEKLPTLSSLSKKHFQAKPGVVGLRNQMNKYLERLVLSLREVIAHQAVEPVELQVF